MRAIAGVVLLPAVLAASFSVGGAEPLTKRDTRGPVTVAVTLIPTAAGSGTLKARVVLETHSVSLDGIAFEDVVVLRPAAGSDLPPAAVEPRGAGHHREAVVVFAAPPGPVRIVVKDVGGIPERIFSWDVPADGGKR